MNLESIFIEDEKEKMHVIYKWGGMFHDGVTVTWVSHASHVAHDVTHVTRHTSHVAHDGALSAGGGGRPARPEHLGVEPVADQDQHQRRLGLQGLQLLICNMSGVSLVSHN